MEYEFQAHTTYLLLSHLILVCKYRKKLLLSYGEEVKRIFEKIAARSDFSFEATLWILLLYDWQRQSSNHPPVY